ncbi:ion channel [Micromonospora endolithica]|uniref:Two pore domain potassium channel family protein n=1 Tax=Micromonospora endolithica TaxID=230091 RepID=A0A3A9YTR6_9ACTN|nr:ion channel [Micromonospora endolithica]RKN38884.1 two pore domain potassium channel family protein [Micromonospora endolithica]TWJ25509.1 ion channel [Micromonospora endolithica]
MPLGNSHMDPGRFRITRRARFHYALIRHRLAWLFAIFTGFYGLIAILYAVCYQLLAVAGLGEIKEAGSFGDRLYYSFITQLSVDYDNLAPSGLSKPVAVTQAFAGTVLFGVLIAYVVLRITSPDPRTLLLSPVAIYLEAERKLAILLVNTSGIIVTDLSMSMVLKLRRRHTRLYEVALPYLRDSALLVKGLDYDPELDDIGAGYDPSEDGLKVSVRCSILGSTFGIGSKYSLTKVVVAPNDDFMDRPEFQDPDLTSREFWALFAWPVEDAVRLHDLLMAKARTVADGQAA